jgi:V8-like Glu-specific endopeptidase
MTSHTYGLAAALGALLIAAAAHAQEPGLPGEGSGAAPRAIGEGLALRNGEPLKARRFDPGETSRSVDLDPQATERAYGTVTRTKGGEETRAPASETLLRAVRDKRAATPADASTETAEAPRGVFGSDTRVRVTDTSQYPFSAVGIVEGVTASGEVYQCSAALIGPRTVLTTASCLYDHASGWHEEFLFAPGLNTFDDTPFGVYDWQTAHIFEGFLSAYDGSYGSVLAYDMALLILAEPAGDHAGWLGIQSDPQLGAFHANILGYPYDKEPQATQWRSNCDVAAAQVRPQWIEHYCATSYGTGGAPIYTYDTATRNRYIQGIDVAEGSTGNIAARITDPAYIWMMQYLQ